MNAASRTSFLAARLLFGAYVLLTSFYCLLVYIPFTYHELIESHLLGWVTAFARLHHFLFWPVFASALATIRRDFRTPTRAAAWAFALLGAVAGFWLALHPLLPSLRNDSWSFLASLLTLLPYGDIPRVPARYVVMTILCLAVMAGAGVCTLLKRRRPVVQRTVTAGLIILIVGENAVLPVAVWRPQEPAVFVQIRNDPRRVGVIEVPIPDDPGTYPERMMYQTIHNKPIYGGYLARGLPPLAFSAVPGFGQFKALSDTVDDVVIYNPVELPAISRAVLNFYSAGYVVIEKQLMDAPAAEKGRQIADGLFGPSARVYEDDRMLAYLVSPAETAAPIAVWLDTGWSYLERLPDRGPDGRPLRWHWMGERSRLGMISSEPTYARLKFTAQSFGRVRRMQFVDSGFVIATIPITPDRTDYETPVFQVPAGRKLIEINSLDGADSPGQDARRLSIAVYRLEVVR